MEHLAAAQAGWSGELKVDRKRIFHNCLTSFKRPCLDFVHSTFFFSWLSSCIFCWFREEEEGGMTNVSRRSQKLSLQWRLNSSSQVVLLIQIIQLQLIQLIQISAVEAQLIQPGGAAHPNHPSISPLFCELQMKHEATRWRNAGG